MIDPLNIFKEIKKYINNIYPETHILAFGSRVRGTSYHNKWDFDVIILNNEVDLNINKINHSISLHFKGRKDENNKPIKVDIFKALKPLTLTEFKKLKTHGCML